MFGLLDTMPSIESVIPRWRQYHLCKCRGPLSFGANSATLSKVQSSGNEGLSVEVPLFCRASGFGPLFTIVEAEQGPSALMRLRRDSGFGLANHAPSTLVPFPVMNRAFNIAARLCGDGQFGMRIGQAIRLEDFGPFVEYALHGNTLQQFIQRAMVAIQYHNTESFTDLRVTGPRAFWRLLYRSNAESTLEHHAQRSLIMMLSAVRHYATAQTGDIELQVPGSHAPEGRRLENHLDIRVRSRTDDYELVFPSAWLHIPLPIAGLSADLTSDVLTSYHDRPLPSAMAEAVVAALALHEDLPGTGIGSAAAKIGMPTRTLQHALRREGVSYRDILRTLRVRRAQLLLATTEQSLAEVSLRVGYSDASNFHRAFVSLSGMTPGRFRETASYNRPIHKQ